MSFFSIYLIRCRDGSIYTGIATDVERRLTEHEQGDKGAKYLRGRGDVTLIYSQEIGDRSLASKIESRVKRLSKFEKENTSVLGARIETFVSQCLASAE